MSISLVAIPARERVLANEIAGGIQVHGLEQAARGEHFARGVDGKLAGSGQRRGEEEIHMKLPVAFSGATCRRSGTASHRDTAVCHDSKIARPAETLAAAREQRLSVAASTSA